MRITNLSFCLVLALILFDLAVLSLPDNEQEIADLQNSSQEYSIDTERLSEINFMIDTYFQNCQTDQESQIKYNCSIKVQIYPEFLYGLFHKQIITSFLSFYSSQEKIEQKMKVQSVQSLGQNIRELVTEAYKEWADIYKPNQFITVEEMYGDVIDLDKNVFEVISHYPQKYSELLQIYKNVYKIQPLEKKYAIMGEKEMQEIADDFLKIYQVYFGQCSPITQCSIPLKRFVYLAKDLAFYMTPLVEDAQQKKQGFVLISNQMDFKATKFLMEKIKQAKTELGDQVDYPQIKEFSDGLVLSLFEYLRQDQNLQSNNKIQEDLSNDQNISKKQAIHQEL